MMPGVASLFRLEPALSLFGKYVSLHWFRRRKELTTSKYEGNRASGRVVCDREDNGHENRGKRPCRVARPGEGVISA
ncbi:hypothetical protein Hdeb2414_s0002g00064741 [Helianthus debilis subsp. tardiflorus]